MTNLFSGLGSAPVFERGTFMNPGIYDVQIGKCIAKDSENSGFGLIVEFDILTSLYKPQQDPANQGRTWQPQPANTMGTWWQGLTDKKVGNPAIKAFVRAVLGLKSDNPLCWELDQIIPNTRPQLCVIENLMLMATGELNVFAGLLVHLECTMILTQKKKEDFTVYNWTPLNFEAFGMAPPDAAGLISRAKVPFMNQQQWGGAPTQPSWPQPAPQGPPPGTWGPPVQQPPPWPVQFPGQASPGWGRR